MATDMVLRTLHLIDWVLHTMSWNDVVLRVCVAQEPGPFAHLAERAERAQGRGGGADRVADEAERHHAPREAHRGGARSHAGAQLRAPTRLCLRGELAGATLLGCMDALCAIGCAYMSLD
jgi:hypothetical protein